MPSPQPQKQVSGRLRRLAFLLIACTVFTVLAHELKYPASAWPSEREVLSGRSIFGKPGDTRSLVTVTLPYPLRPSWAPDTEITSITCHGLVAGSLINIFQKTLDHYGLERIRELHLDVYGGCFNNRPVRGAGRPSARMGNCRGPGPFAQRHVHARAGSCLFRSGIRCVLVHRGRRGGVLPGARAGI